MHLYLARHGIAGERDPARYPDDATRPLTAEGVDRTDEVARGLQALGARVDLMITSPLLRAAQTADILARRLTPDRQPLPAESLKPNGSFALFMKWLGECAVESVMAVGHMPDIGEFAQQCLTGGRGFEMTFKKAAVCCLAFDGEPSAGRARLEWLMQPAALRRLGG